MTDSIFTALQQPFFLRSLVVVVILATVFPLYGNIVVARQEANIAHTFAHMGLLGVAVGLWFDLPIQISILCSVILTVILLFFLGSKESKNHVAHNEILAQLGLVGAILLVSQMSGYKADISSYLFGDVLLLGTSDVYLITGISIVVLLLYIFFGKRWFAISLDQNMALSKRIPTQRGYILYLIALGLLIGSAMKIIGVLLVSAFLILPSNIGKLTTENLRGWIICGVIIGIITSVIALFLSRHIDMPSGATIIACLLSVYGIVRLVKKPH